MRKAYRRSCISMAGSGLLDGFGVRPGSNVGAQASPAHVAKGGPLRPACIRFEVQLPTRSTAVKPAFQSIAMLLFAVSAVAQPLAQAGGSPQATALTLEDALTIAEAKSEQVAIARAGVTRADEEKKRARSERLSAARRAGVLRSHARVGVRQSVRGCRRRGGRVGLRGSAVRTQEHLAGGAAVLAGPLYRRPHRRRSRRWPRRRTVLASDRGRVGEAPGSRST